jgi:hypothetical protein
MKYLVLEIQVNADGSVSIPPIASYDVRNEAESKYHSVLAAAAISTVEMHSAVLLTSDGKNLERKSYNHVPEVTPVIEEVRSNG